MTIRYYLICTFLCATCTIEAQDVYIQAADSLFRQHRYADAAIAYERVLFADTDPAHTYYAVNGKLQCLKQQHLFGQAASFVKMNLTDQLPDTVRYGLLHEQLICTYLAGSFEDALAIAEQLKIAYPAQRNNKRLLLVQLLSLNELQRWKDAATLFSEFTRDQPAGSFQNPYERLPRLKSKDRAQWLSTFIPGAGQWYAGKPLEAMVNIVMQGAGIYFGIVSFQQHYYLSAWLVGAGLFGSFHMGGVRRAETLVGQYNKKQADRFNRTAREQLVNMVNGKW